MPKIQAETANGLIETEAPAGKKLVLAIEDAGVDILHRCGGNARCTTCRVELLEGDPGPMGDLERDRLAMEAELEPNIRLSCQIHVQSDLKVRVVNQVSVRGMDAGPRPLDE
jgi:ferredoxin